MITIFTTFRSADAAYSLNRVVQQQIKMFLKHNYEVQVVVAQGFKPIEEYERVKCIEIPDVPVHNDVYIDKTFDEDVIKLKEALKPILEASDIMITHDLVYQSAALKHNTAVRQLINEMGDSCKTKFIHWIHSAGEPAIIAQLRGGGNKYLEMVKQPFPRSLYITFNQYSTPRLANWFGIEQDLVKYVPHPHDFCEYFHPRATQIVEKGNLLQKDVVIVYPCRLDRGKQPEYVIKIGHAIKSLGRSVGVVIMDFHSTAGDKVTYRNELKNLALTLGMAEDEVMFTSELDGETPIYEMPNQVVSNLFEISNTFILPSKTETYSLVAQEAAAKRNLCILNFDFPPMRSIFGDAPHYVKFSSCIDAMTGMDGGTETKYTDEAAQWKSVAQYILYSQEHTRVLALFNKIKKERNLDTVFRKHIEPLLFATGQYNY